MPKTRAQIGQAVSQIHTQRRGPWTKAKNDELKKLHAALIADPPGPFATPEEQREWRDAVQLASAGVTAN